MSYPAITQDQVLLTPEQADASDSVVLAWDGHLYVSWSKVVCLQFTSRDDARKGFKPGTNLIFLGGPVA